MFFSNTSSEAWAEKTENVRGLILPLPAGRYPYCFASAAVTHIAQAAHRSCFLSLPNVSRRISGRVLLPHAAVNENIEFLITNVRKNFKGFSSSPDT